VAPPFGYVKRYAFPRTHAIAWEDNERFVMRKSNSQTDSLHGTDH